MDPYEDFVQENVGFEFFEHFHPDGQKNKCKYVEEFLEPEEYIDHGHLFITGRIFNSNDELVDWAKQIAMKANTYLIVNRYQKSRTFDCRSYLFTITVMLRLQHLRRSSCNRLSSSGRVMCRLETSYDFSVNKTAQKIYNVVVKIKKNMMQSRNTVEEVLCLSAKWGYTVFYKNRKESNVFSDIGVAHPTSIAMIRTWLYLKILALISYYFKTVSVQYATIGSCRDVSDQKELHSCNCIYVQ
ncbi:hypothetical protein M9H77_26471 [Catharanthus roseus]|uniref:Uncharacterized protein n=1 Tax=Catharanthus roseus TaxID=4058 RepID=A0ACC0ACF8_CATRO|nr:hypothetical protein M9H77_26471 [Catharanthus roseus]